VINVFGQNAQQEINEQVWRPFIKTLNEKDTEGFLALHSKDVIRSPRDTKAVWNWNEYFQNQKKNDQQRKSSGSDGTLDLRFTERISGGDQAIEVGVYKYTTTNAEGVSKHYYGRFHVALRKENDIWKILVDTDSSEGNSISEKDFMAATPMDDK
jgi:ketosteroid isomerase-like protein